MPVLMATTAFGLGRRHQASTEWFQLHHLHTTKYTWTNVSVSAFRALRLLVGLQGHQPVKILPQLSWSVLFSEIGSIYNRRPVKNTIFATCHHGRCPKYLRDVCTPVYTVAARSWLQSADNGNIVIPCTVTTRFSSHRFRIAGSSV